MALLLFDTLLGMVTADRPEATLWALKQDTDYPIKPSHIDVTNPFGLLSTPFPYLGPFSAPWEEVERALVLIVRHCQLDDLWSPFTPEEVDGPQQVLNQLETFGWIHHQEGKYCVTHLLVTTLFACSPRTPH